MIMLTILFYICLLMIVLAAILRFLLKTTLRIGVAALPIYCIYELLKEK